MWFRIQSIEKIENGSHIGYCFEVLNDEEPYFMLPTGLVTHNCRLRLDLRELRKKNGGYFGSGESTGSIGVVTLNMPRLAYTSNSETEFFKKLDKMMDIAARSLHIKRKVVTQLLDQGLYPYTKRYLGSFDNHFSTIGLLGMNEACLNASWLRCKISDIDGYEFSKRVLDHMRERLSDYQEMYPGELFNLESSPAESTTYRFAKHDKEDYPDIITAGDKTDGSPYYTNSTHLPVDYTEDIFTALDHQDDLQTKYTSGTVFHAFLGEKLPSWQSAMALTRKIAENYKLPYFTFSPTYSICPDHGYITGEHWTCPECGKTTEVYSRVTGYYRAVQNFNDGKAHEFKDRKEYKVNGLTDDSEQSESTFECASCGVDYSESQTESDSSAITLDKPVLITTATCPNCKMAKKFIADAGFDCDIVLAEESEDLVNMFGVHNAPTLIVVEDGEPRLINNVSNIRKYLETVK
jgi:ribonucleoside-triphosphate reductase